MPTPTNKSRQNLGSLFARNAIPTEGDFADLIASCLNLTDDGVLKLPDQSLGLVRQRPASTAPANQRPVLSLFEEAGGQAAWEIQLQNSSGKSGFALADQTKNAKLFLDKNTGNLGIGTSDPQAKLHVGGSMRVDTDLTILGDLTATGRVEIGGTATATKAPNSKLGSTGQAAIRGTVSQLDFIDNDANQLDWAIRVDQSKLSFVRAPAVDTTLVLQSNGNVGVGTSDPQAKLHVGGSMRVDTDLTILGPLTATGRVEFGPTATATATKTADFKLSHSGQVAIRGTSAQLDFLDTDSTQKDWSIHVNEGKMLFASAPNEPYIVLNSDANKSLNLLTRNQICISSSWQDYAAYRNGTRNDCAEISNDTGRYKCLMIAGNKSSGLGDGRRQVRIYDDLGVENNIRSEGVVVRKVWATCGTGYFWGKSAVVTGRTLSVNKVFSDTQLRICYYDTFQIALTEEFTQISLRWRILINDTDSTIFMDRHVTTGNQVISGTIVGFAKNLSAGTHKITVKVDRTPASGAAIMTNFNNLGNDKVSTGWLDTTWTLEAEEVLMANAG
jgi:hypothetical protein